MITDEEFENIKQDNNLKIGVELAKGRVFLIDAVKDTTCLVWGASFSIIMIISFFISIYCLGFLGGIIYAILFCLLYSGYIGVCSVNSNSKKIIYYISIAFLIISFAFELKITILSVFTCLSVISAYMFYNYILHRTIEEALKNKKVFEFLLESNTIILL